jgi:hypothetical protein
LNATKSREAWIKAMIRQPIRFHALISLSNFLPDGGGY